jgi:hypothetical protein
MNNNVAFSPLVKVGAPDECWPWTGPKSGGYGIRHAHRSAWAFVHGPIPKGMFVLHSCDVKSCCNPAHLHLGTHAENMREAAERGRLHWSKLTADVPVIRGLALAGMSQKDIAKRYGVTPPSIHAIVAGITYKHVDGVILPQGGCCHACKRPF